MRLCTCARHGRGLAGVCETDGALWRAECSENPRNSLESCARPTAGYARRRVVAVGRTRGGREGCGFRRERSVGRFARG